jgi:hypothetical protein
MLPVYHKGKKYLERNRYVMSHHVSHHEQVDKVTILVNTEHYICAPGVKTKTKTKTHQNGR